jgi:hypothetical protein
VTRYGTKFAPTALLLEQQYAEQTTAATLLTRAVHPPFLFLQHKMQRIPEIAWTLAKILFSSPFFSFL